MFVSALSRGALRLLRLSQTCNKNTHTLFIDPHKKTVVEIALLMNDWTISGIEETQAVKYAGYLH